jgi:hypothetical protein
MELDSYARENYILQREETSPHLFLKCNFARICWGLLEITPPYSSNLHAAFKLMPQ